MVYDQKSFYNRTDFMNPTVAFNTSGHFESSHLIKWILTIVQTDLFFK